MNDYLSQVGQMIAYPWSKPIPVFDLFVAVFLIAVIVWFLADSTQWPEIA